MKPCDTLPTLTSARGRWAGRWHALRCRECHRARAADARLAREARILSREAPAPELEARILARLGLETPARARCGRAIPAIAAAAAGGLALAAVWIARPAPPVGKAAAAGPPAATVEAMPPKQKAPEAMRRESHRLEQREQGRPDRHRVVRGETPPRSGEGGSPRLDAGRAVADPLPEARRVDPLHHRSEGRIDGEGPILPDMLYLNEGALVDARPALPALPPPEAVSAPPLQERGPGSRLLDDLLLLNPIRVAGASDAGLGAAAAAMTEEAVDRDARLQRKVTLHAVTETLSDVLALLSRGTGVTLMARMEIADEPITIWAEERPLIDVMRDLRHLRGYLWSRTKRGDSYVYSLWQDMQSRAREEAEEQRRAVEAQRRFAEDVRRRIDALNAGEAELKRLAREEPYLVAQMKHPVVRSAYRLFATLSPDQQAQLLQGQTPCRGSGAGLVLDLFPRASYYRFDGQQVISDPKRVARHAPRGDVVTLRPAEMTAAQRAALDALLQGTLVARQQQPFQQGIIELTAADRRVESVSFFRWGDPLWQGVSLRVDFTSGGRPWGIYSNFALPRSSYEFYNDLPRKGEFRAWPGAQEEIDRYLGVTRTGGTTPPLPAKAEPAPDPDERPDPILDAPISVRWPMARRPAPNPRDDAQFHLTGRELLALLHRDLRRPLVMEAMPRELRQAQPTEFRYEKRPLRGLLKQLFPRQRIHTSGGTIFVTSSPELRPRHRTPRAVREFLEGLTEPFSLDDMALLARSLSPWQLANLGRYFQEVPMVIDQALLLQDLLKLYGELAPAQRSAVARGLPFTAMTPTQQALFLAFAQRQRPFVEAWRFQQGELRITVAPVPKPEKVLPWSVPVARATFDVRFHDDEAQSYRLDLYPQVQRQIFPKLADMIGRPFPFPIPGRGPSTPALADPAFRKKPLVIACGWPFALPYAGRGPAPDLDAWARSLAGRLQTTGMTVVQVTVAAPGPDARREKSAPLPNLIRRVDPGDEQGQPWDTAWGGYMLTRSPTVFVLGKDEIVRAVFEGQDAWDTGAIERAAREAVGRSAAGK